jgi:hypothetical protein
MFWTGQPPPPPSFSSLSPLALSLSSPLISPLPCSLSLSNMRRARETPRRSLHPCEPQADRPPGATTRRPAPTSPCAVPRADARLQPSRPTEAVPDPMFRPHPKPNRPSSMHRAPFDFSPLMELQLLRFFLLPLFLSLKPTPLSSVMELNADRSLPGRPSLSSPSLYKRDNRASLPSPAYPSSPHLSSSPVHCSTLSFVAVRRRSHALAIRHP